MTSYVYLAFGTKNNSHFMKVGKANSVEKRQRQIGIQIELSLSCETEREAFILESKLRQMMRQSGAVRVDRTKDWFTFDGRVYDDVCAFVTNQNNIDLLLRYDGKLSAEDNEISILQARCIALFTDEIKHLTDEVKRLEQVLIDEYDQWRLDIERLIREEQQTLVEKLARAEMEIELWRAGRLKPE